VENGLPILLSLACCIVDLTCARLPVSQKEEAAKAASSAPADGLSFEPELPGNTSSTPARRTSTRLRNSSFLPLLLLLSKFAVLHRATFR
jgi:hypothetical protein